MGDTPKEKQPVTLDNVYGEICDFEELHLSYLEARKGKRYRDEILEYSANLEENQITIQNELIWESYTVGRYRPFYVTEPKLRLVMALQFKDRIVQWSVYRKLNPFYDRLFIEDSYACRVGKGSHAAADRLQYWLKQVSRKPGKWYYLKLDISKFFYRVDHDILFDVLRRRVTDERLLRLLRIIINSEDMKFGLPAGMAPEECPEELWLDDVGMPIGNLTSQLFANIYLNELDQYCKHSLKTHFYLRYMDDIIILSSDKKELAACKEDIENFLRDNLRLDLNSKTAIRPISCGVEFVGYMMWATHRKLRKSTARRIIRKMKTISSRLADGTMSREEFDRRIASYRGILKHCESFGLRKKLNEVYKRALQDGKEPQPGKEEPME